MTQSTRPSATGRWSAGRRDVTASSNDCDVESTAWTAGSTSVLPEILAGPTEREGGIWMRFGVTYKRVGLPDLYITGDHTTYFHSDRICRIEEYVPISVGKTVGRVSRRPRGCAEAVVHRAADVGRDHAAAGRRLRGGEEPAGHRRGVEPVQRRFRARDGRPRHARGGQRHGAPPPGSLLPRLSGLSRDARRSRHRRRNTQRLGSGAHDVRRSRSAEMPPTGRTAELAVFCVFTFAGDRIRSERFFFDLATLCEQTRHAARAAARGDGGAEGVREGFLTTEVHRGHRRFGRRCDLCGALYA